MDYAHIYRQPSRLYLLILNIATVAVAIALFALGIFSLASESSVLLDSTFLSWTLASLGLAALLVSMLGCASSLGMYKSVLATYSIILSLLVLPQFMVIIYASTRHEKIGDLMDHAWQKAYNNNKQTIQDLETRLQCCGYADITDRSAPANCANSPAFGYTTSCKARIYDTLTYRQNATITIVTAIELLQIMALTAGLVLWSKLPRENEIDSRYRDEHSRRILQGLSQEDERNEVNQNPGYGTMNSE